MHTDKSYSNAASILQSQTAPVNIPGSTLSSSISGKTFVIKLDYRFQNYYVN